MYQELTTSLFEQEVLTSNLPVLVDFWSPSCGPCKMQEKVLNELEAESAGQFEIKKVNVWDEPELATRFQISAVPTLMIFDQGKVVKSFVGYQDKARILRGLQGAV